MGMMDYLRSSFDLGPQFTDVQLQTKDIEEFGIGGSMTHYYLDPSGYLCYGESQKMMRGIVINISFLTLNGYQQVKEVSIKFIPLPNIFLYILLNGRESGLPGLL
jgi:hypothetical protein